jgi:hypothetical protein
VEKNCLYYGDNLTVLREHIKDESVDLITSDAKAVRGNAGSDRSAPDADRIESWWPSQQRDPGTTGAEGEVLQKWRNIGQFSAVLVRISLQSLLVSPPNFFEKGQSQMKVIRLLAWAEH